MELLDYWRLIRQQLWLVAALTVLVPALTVTGYYVLPQETRQALGRLMVTQAAMTETIAGPEGPQAVRVDPAGFIFSLIVMIESETTADAVMERLRQEGTTPNRRPVLTAEKLPKTNMIEIKARGNTPGQAVAIVQAAMEEFMNLWEDYNQRNARETRLMVEQRRDRALEGLTEIDEEITTFQAKYGIIDPVQELVALQANLGPLEQTQTEAEASLTDAQQQAKRYREQAEKESQYGEIGLNYPPNPWRETLRTQIWQLHVERQRLLQEFQEDAPEVQELDAQIAQAQARLMGEPELIEQPGISLPVNAYREGLRQRAFEASVEVESRQRRVGLVKELAQENRQRVELLRKVQTEYERLYTQRDLARSAYQRMLQAVEEAKTIEERAAKRGLIYIQEDARPVVRGGVGLKARAIGSAALGLILGLMAAVGVGYLSRTIQTEEDARMLLGYRVLVGIPRVDLATAMAERPEEPPLEAAPSEFARDEPGGPASAPEGSSGSEESPSPPPEDQPC